MAAMEPRLFRYTRTQFERMAERGDFRGRRVQLIEGRIVEMSPQKAPHTVSVELVKQILERTFGDGWWCRSQAPLHLSKTSAPEPDGALVRGRARDFLTQPTTAELVVEVSDITLRFDIGRKMRTYARANLAEYWVLDLNSRCLVVHRQPGRDAEGHPRYASVLVIEADGCVSPLALPQALIRVADLLP